MKTTTIYNNREEVIKAAEFIGSNIASAFIGMKGNNTYYNIKGIVWGVWQSGCGNFPTTNNIKIEDFKL